jgi:hypothetical protein
VTALQVRRAGVVAIVFGVVLVVGWLISAASSPFHDYFLYQVTWPNRLAAVGFPAFLIGALLSGNIHAPATWSLVIGFLAEWLPIGYLVAILVVRRKAVEASPREGAA